MGLIIFLGLFGIMIIGCGYVFFHVFSWIFAPAKDLLADTIQESITPNIPQSILIKDAYFDINEINSFEELETKKFIYRPETLNEYIGQQRAKDLIELNLKKIWKLRPVNFLISGWRGCGKSTLAHVIKNHLNTEIIEKIAGEIENPDQITALINQINQTKCKYPILFIDELHALKPSLCEIFYPILEDFKISGKNIKPFIFIGATTEKNILMNKVAPLCDRIQVHVELDKYTEDEIVEILQQYRKQLYPYKQIKKETYQIIAKNCRYVPRLAITLMEDSIIEPNIKSVLDCHKIIKDGITITDIQILELLAQTTKPMGEKAISMACGISNADYNSLYEPFLCEKQYILRTSRGRTIGEKGKQFLGVK